MARVQPQPPPEDLQWEELEEMGEETGEREKEVTGERGGREGSKDARERNKDAQNREGLQECYPPPVKHTLAYIYTTYIII